MATMIPLEIRIDTSVVEGSTAAFIKSVRFRLGMMLALLASRLMSGELRFEMQLKTS